LGAAGDAHERSVACSCPDFIIEIGNTTGVPDKILPALQNFGNSFGPRRGAQQVTIDFRIYDFRACVLPMRKRILHSGWPIKVLQARL
jgi:hypothetical protein